MTSRIVLPRRLNSANLSRHLCVKPFVADGEHFVHEQHVGIDVNRDREAEAHVHAGRVGLHRRVDELLHLGELDDLVEAARDLALGQAEHDAVDEDVLAAGDLRVEAGAELDQRRDAAVDVHRAAGRLRDAGDELQQRALAGPVAADDAERAPGRHREGHVVARAVNVSSGSRSRIRLRDSSALFSVANCFARSG